MRREILPRFAASAILLLFVGCVPVPPEQPGALQSTASTPPAVTIAGSATTATATTPVQATALSPGTRAAVPEVRALPPGTQTGVAAVDSVIAAALGPQGLRPLLRYITTPCTTMEGLGGPPKCAAGEAAGTPVEVFPVGGPEGSFARAGDAGAFLPLEVAGLYGAYKVSANAYREEYWPAGEYGVVFLRPDGLFLDARVTSDGVVRIDYPPPGMGNEWWKSTAESWVVPPLGLSPAS